MMKPLPSGPWEALFPRAVLLMDEIERYGGASDPFWTLGGGTVLMSGTVTVSARTSTSSFRIPGTSAT